MFDKLKLNLSGLASRFTGFLDNSEANNSSAISASQSEKEQTSQHLHKKRKMIKKNEKEDSRPKPASKNPFIMEFSETNSGEKATNNSSEENEAMIPEKEEKMSQKHQNFNKYLSLSSVEISEKVKCQSCKQVIIFPCETECGHNFCYECLDQILTEQTKCPECSMRLLECEMYICRTLDQIILNKMVALESDSPQRIEYESRRQKTNIYMQKRTVDLKKLEIGQHVDIRDESNVWIQCRILKVYDESQKSILVHYEKFDTLYDEVIDCTKGESFRVAPCGFFSSRENIRRYQIDETVDDNKKLKIVPNERSNFMSSLREMMTGRNLIQRT